jgi:uncharacterized repeat protein (TIGR03803 family)
MEAANGKLYGMTSQGGASNLGVLFEYDPTTATYTKKIDFDGTTKGRYPYGSLMEATNGKIYGMTSSGGVFNKGVLFEFDPTTATYTKKLDYDGVNGQNPQYGHLIEVSTCYSTVSNFSVIKCTSYTVPSTDETYTTVGTYNVMDTIANSCGGDSIMTISLTLLPALTGTHNETVCFGDSIVVNGTTYDASNLTGTEVFTNIGANNCDSTVAVTLTILPELTGAHNETVCFGGSIVVNNTTYDSNNLTGTEVFTNIGANNCDSTVTVTLTIEPAIDVNVTTSSPNITSNQTGATYRWLDCNNNNSIIVGETGLTYTATANGDYAVEITVGNCVDTSACTTITGVGISENTVFNAVNIYPNPNKGIVNIELGDLKEVTVKVFNTNGQLVHQQENVNTPTYQFEITGAKGIYFIELSVDGLTKHFKVIKD